MSGRGGPKTAAELLAELNPDPDFRRREAARLRRRKESLEADDRYVDAVVERLRQGGCVVETLDDVDPRSAPPQTALPILAAALRGFGVRETSVIARIAKAVTRVAPGADGAAVLLDEFARRVDAEDEPVRWTLANAAEEHVTPENEAKIAEILAADRYGASRHALLPGLARIERARRSPRRTRPSQG